MSSVTLTPALPPAPAPRLTGAPTRLGKDTPRRSRVPVALVVAAILFAPPAVILSLGAAYLEAKGAVAERLLRRAWHETSAAGRAVEPWAGASARPAGRIVSADGRLDAVVLTDQAREISSLAPTWIDRRDEVGVSQGVLIVGYKDEWARGVRGARRGDVVVLHWLDTPSHRARARSYKVARVGAPDSSVGPGASVSDRETLTLVVTPPPTATGDNVLPYVVQAVAISR